MSRLIVFCTACQIRLTVAGVDEQHSVSCPRCRNEVARLEPLSGYIYILSNPSMNNLFKVGFTCREIPERIAELNAATGVPSPFRLEGWACALDAAKAEHLIHGELRNFNVGKEFFNAQLQRIVSVIEGVLGSPVFPPGPPPEGFAFMTGKAVPTIRCGTCKYEGRGDPKQDVTCPACHSDVIRVLSIAHEW
jgi:Zn finger protein HypA/HybF involved in hydrogenase expression